MSLLVKAQAQGRTIVEVTPASAGWKHVGFECVRLKAGEQLQHAVPSGREACFVVLTGSATVGAGGRCFERIGGRASVFDAQSPEAVYAPPGTVVDVLALDDVELAIATAPASGRYPVRLIGAETMTRSTRGQGSNTRYICDILPQAEQAESLLVVEVLTPASHSSSYPPHKHDRDDFPHESQLEETYYHRIHPPQGFAFQRVYTDSRDLDESMAVCDRDVVMVPRGYHPVVMPHGYRGYYLNVMAGSGRAWHFKNDPAHEWLVRPRDPVLESTTCPS